MFDADDRLHINAIRKALVNGNAAVMVGAGFSKNANGGEKLKTWDEIAIYLWETLNPDGDKKDFSASNVLQLGEQYARVFSTPELEKTIKELVPDEKVTPGKLHQELLELNWAEIFTTNYDTLLERAAEDIIELDHYTVTCREDIPNSNILGRKRIVKLHGSFPSQRPFIFTEEDYRTYPQKFSPFVNLVRHSLLENVFCLIGFSGEDPNFLSWIGWARDVLDKHTLPVYLFTAKKLSIGQRKLLESRNVIPISLPQIEGAGKQDYKQRYQYLFDQLKEPHSQKVTDWGSNFNKIIDNSTYEPDHKKRYEKLLKIMPELTKLRRTYPGWLIAPYTVRKTLESNLNYLPIDLDSAHLYQSLESEHPLSAITLLSYYGWQQDIILQCFDDNFAKIACNLLTSITEENLPIYFEKEKNELGRLSISTINDLVIHKEHLSFNILRWCREGLKRDVFHEIKNIINKTPNNADKIKHEEIIFLLYEGARDKAKKELMEWNVHSSDAFMEVRKGALLAEVNEINLGISFAMNGLQNLRRIQKQNDANIQYLSEEGWACLIIKRMQAAKNILKYNEPADEKENIVSRRISYIATQGIDVEKELNDIMADLNAEAQPPSESQYRTPKFGLGQHTSMHHLGTSSDLTRKIHAAFSWLTLTDRVALSPRIGQVSFNTDTYIQAAWWAQYFDSTERVLSVAIRTLNKDILKPKDKTKPAHRSNWLSRVQVATIQYSTALRICKDSLELITKTISSESSPQEIELVTNFHLSVFSRLVLRITDEETIISYAKSIVLLLNTSAVGKLSNTWRTFNEALESCLEALPYTYHQAFITLLTEIPLLPIEENVHERWIGFSRFTNHTRKHTTKIIPDKIIMHIKLMIEKISDHSTSDTTELYAWNRLQFLNYTNLIPADLMEMISSILWKDKKKWPQINSFHAWVTYTWPLPKKIDAHKLFRHWILSEKIEHFSTTLPEQSSVKKSAKSWRTSTHEIMLINFSYSLSKHKWPAKDFKIALDLIIKWWNEEWHDMAKAMSKYNDLRSCLIARLDHIDDVLSQGPLSLLKTSSATNKKYTAWIEDLIKNSHISEGYFWQYRIYHGISNKDKKALNTIEQEISNFFFDSNPANFQHIAIASASIIYWAKHKAASSFYTPKTMTATLAGIIASRKMPNLSWALHVLVTIAKYQPQWINDQDIFLLETGLDKMLSELAYKDRTSGSGIPDEEIPLLRLNCARLALALLSSKQFKLVPALKQWVSLSQNDPLPEMRHLEEKYSKN